MPSGNPNLTTGQMLPGFYGWTDYNAGGAGVFPNLRCLIWAYIGATATATPNQPFRPIDALDAQQRCGGASTDAARFYAAATSQPEAQGADVWIMPISEPSGGQQSTYKITVFVPGTNPSKAGSIQAWIASQASAVVGFSTTDTATTIASNLAAAIAAMPNAPVASAVAVSGVITITYTHKGTTGEDLPLRCTVSPNSTGVFGSPAQALFATNATGAGSVVITVGAISVTTALSGGETPAQVATKVAASWNSSTYPVTAVVDAGTPAQVDFYFQAGFDVRRMSASVVTTTGLTVNLGSGATNGAGSPSSFSYNGTQGTGAPTLTTALTNLQSSQQAYRAWVCPWVDAASIGSLATAIESMSNGSQTGQKLQIMVVADWQPIATDGAIPTATSPNLTTTPPHYTFGWAPDTSVQCAELSARNAAARAAYWISLPAFNWNGWRFMGNSTAPILAPAVTAQPSTDTLNTALRTYGLSPWVLGPSGNIEVKKGRTTSLAADLRLWAWSAEAQAAYHIQDLQNFYPSIFQGASIVRYTTPKSPNEFDAQSVIDVTVDRMALWERQGNYDGAALFAKAVKCAVNSGNPNRFDVDFPESPVLDLDQIVYTAHFGQPPQ